MRSDTFNFEIPPALIAQTPAERRDASRLMVVRRSEQSIEHHTFRDLPGLLRPDDLLVMNNTRVRPCRLHCRKETGGHVELFLLRPLEPGVFEALTGSWRNIPSGARIKLPGDGGWVTLIEKDNTGHWRVGFDMPANEIDAYLKRAAKMPLPPYIKREKFDDALVDLDRERYQTVFAEADGAVAAPTAGLHFTPEVLDTLGQRGIERTYLTLHVGPGTFRPLKSETLAEHPMHSERYEVSPAACAAVRSARTNGGRVVVVGTTSCRTLETVSNERGLISPASGETDLFIYPPYRFRCTDALLTNFHLPHSTLIFLVAAWLGVELTRQAYEEALTERYRFFSYGDAMLCLP